MSREDRRRFLDNAGADTARLSLLVTRLLDLARADMARPETRAATDVVVALRRAADAIVRETFRVELRLPDETPLAAVPEPTLDTVLNVLFENSRQAGAGVVVVTFDRTPEAILLRIADDGPGIPAADRAQLFAPFFTSRRAEGGTGLGLSIARSLLAASHGAIQLVESETGAAFEVTLPPAR